MAQDTQTGDRELDNEFIAEHVMGWKRGDKRRGDMPWYPPNPPRHGKGGTLVLPDWLNDVVAAFTVIERLVEMDYWLTWHTTCDKGLFDMSIYKVGEWHEKPIECVVFTPFALAVAKCAAATVRQQQA